MPAETVQHIIEALLALVGLTGIAFGIRKRSEMKQRLSTGVRADGEVADIEFERDPASPATGYYYPIVTYKTMAGASILKKYTINTYKGQYKIGDKVVVVYDPAEPEKFLIDNGSANQVGPVFIGLGAMFFLGAAIFYLAL
jgi:hypothetical protein